jgi:hypothetical protein
MAILLMDGIENTVEDVEDDKERGVGREERKRDR